jgi:hypothetical protein
VLDSFFPIEFQDVEKIRPSAIIDIIHSGEQLNVQEKVIIKSLRPLLSFKNYLQLEKSVQYSPPPPPPPLLKLAFKRLQ